jgi:hypothetical protein
MTDAASDDPSTTAPVAGDPARRSRYRRELLYLGFIGGFGVLILPFLVYLAGAATLGAYEGGLPSFLGKLYGDFVRLSPAAAALLLGPYLLFQGLRLLTRPLRRRRHRTTDDNPPDADEIPAS